MPRSLKKGPFIDHHLMKKVDDAVKNNNKKANKNMVKKIYVVVPEMVGLTIAVHNGKQIYTGFNFREYGRT